jgi:hypothetical protein
LVGIISSRIISSNRYGYKPGTPVVCKLGGVAGFFLADENYTSTKKQRRNIFARVMKKG